ncbi:guanine nucleotide exchange factor mss4-like protein [Dermatophagoides farinae]|uniref:Guanine nucleotide exchange factor mss4-like protein n=1 Tax=Dermatophagoides farinae TaxID=6954 RepID=A0A9D4NPN3_DERFA|nr:guanine nucleotide exchange factor MSS4 homolog [Dermatophagoides farinae]KAH7637230.1 guanine nucleotide exchange factor mss4-like protein [Dermatophagoides farinae]
MNETNESNSMDHDVVLLSNGNNGLDCHCKIPDCNSLIFRADTAPLYKEERKLPLGDRMDTISSFWRLDDVFKFENVTFTKETQTEQGKIKYLACCDCEYGPIGYQNLENQICYVAIDRVKYCQPKIDGNSNS